MWLSLQDLLKKHIELKMCKDKKVIEAIRRSNKRIAFANQYATRKAKTLIKPKI